MADPIKEPIKKLIQGTREEGMMLHFGDFKVKLPRTKEDMSEFLNFLPRSGAEFDKVVEANEHDRMVFKRAYDELFEQYQYVTKEYLPYNLKFGRDRELVREFLDELLDYFKTGYKEDWKFDLTGERWVKS
jgi:hypothetical protein